MRIAYRISSFVLGAALVLCATSVRAAKPPRIPAYVDGNAVTITVVNSNVVGIDRQNNGADNDAIAAVANPIYFVGYFTVDDQGNTVCVDVQPHVLSIGLGEAGYNPYWDVNYVEVDPDFADTFTSEDDILNSGIEPLDSGFILLCQQISK